MCVVIAVTPTTLHRHCQPQHGLVAAISKMRTTGVQGSVTVKGRPTVRRSAVGHHAGAFRAPRHPSTAARSTPQDSSVAVSTTVPAQDVIIASPEGVVVQPGTSTSNHTCTTHTWKWRGHNIRYQKSGNGGTPVILVHGFGGNADHWRKNTPVLGAQGYTAYAIDLLGYGFSDKPDPRAAPRNSIYCFNTWGQQLTDFIEQVGGGEPAFIVCNSVGGLAGLEASIQRPDLVRGVQLLNISLRGLHVKRQPAWRVPLLTAFQQMLRETQIGAMFFDSVAKPRTVRNILRQAYGRKEAVTDELVDCILKPGLQPGAVSVFLDFISYSGGPLPEELIARTTRPVSILWGEDDPWENITLARTFFGHLPTVKQFITLPGVGHCPQDEAPELVNPLIDKFCKEFAEFDAAN